MATGLNATGVSATGSTGVFPYQVYAIQDAYGTALGNGDLVTLSSGYIVQCAENQVPIGVLRGIRYVDATGTTQFANSYPASTTNTGNIDGITDVYALVEPIEDQVFSITTSDANFTQADVGATKRVKTPGRNATTGRSTLVVDMDAAVTTETRLVKLLGLDPTQGNAFGSGAVALVRVVV